MKILGLIPARAGSERVTNKNIRLLGDKPLIAYTIESALKSKLLDKVVVSTNSSEIATIAKKYGAEVPFLRPDEISDSHSTELQFHEHAISELYNLQKYTPDLIVNLYPTCPFRKPASIDDAINLLSQNPEADSLRSVTLCSEHPFKMWRKNGAYLERFIPKDDIQTQTLSYQLLPEIFIQNACIYISRIETIRRAKSTIGEKVLAFTMDSTEAHDINSELDFILAESLLGRLI